jgi:hypothetical protein
MLVIYMRKYCDREKVDLEILMYFIGFEPPRMKISVCVCSLSA